MKTIKEIISNLIAYIVYWKNYILSGETTHDLAAYTITKGKPDNERFSDHKKNRILEIFG